LRERAGLTGEDVAQHLGWSGSKVSRLELHPNGGERKQLERLAQAKNRTKVVEFSVSYPTKESVPLVRREPENKAIGCACCHGRQRGR
jgi:hypothetical protein